MKKTVLEIVISAVLAYVLALVVWIITDSPTNSDILFLDTIIIAPTIIIVATIIIAIIFKKILIPLTFIGKYWSLINFFFSLYIGGEGSTLNNITHLRTIFTYLIIYLVMRGLEKINKEIFIVSKHKFLIIISTLVIIFSLISPAPSLYKESNNAFDMGLCQIISTVNSRSQKKVDITNWNTYNDPLRKFTVKYPGDWETYRHNNTTGQKMPEGSIDDVNLEYWRKFKQKNDQSNNDIILIIDDIHETSYSQSLETFQSNARAYSYRITDIKIDGIDALRGDKMSCGSSGTIFSSTVLLNKGDYIYYFYAERGSDIGIFNQILATFNFTD